jgi:hypothetical protein
MPTRTGDLRTFSSSTRYQELFLIVTSGVVFLRMPAKSRLQSVVLAIGIFNAPAFSERAPTSIVAVSGVGDRDLQLILLAMAASR